MSNVSLSFVLDAVAKASLILGVAALVAVALRRASASARHFVWTLGLLSALVAPLLSVALPRWEVPLVTLPAPAADAVEATTISRSQVIGSVSSTLPKASRSLEQSSSSPVRNGAVPPPSPSASTDSARPGRSLPSWPILALIVWSAGAALILARMLLGLLAVQWMSRRSREAADAPWLTQAR